MATAEFSKFADILSAALSQSKAVNAAGRAPADGCGEGLAVR